MLLYSNFCFGLIYQVIEPEELYKVGCSNPHTTHCLPSGELMISCLGDGPEGNGKGSFVMIDTKTWKVTGTYANDPKDIPPFGYAAVTDIGYICNNSSQSQVIEIPISLGQI